MVFDPEDKLEDGRTVSIFGYSACFFAGRLSHPPPCLSLTLVGSETISKGGVSGVDELSADDDGAVETRDKGSASGTGLEDSARPLASMRSSD